MLSRRRRRQRRGVTRRRRVRGGKTRKLTAFIYPTLWDFEKGMLKTNARETAKVHQLPFMVVSDGRPANIDAHLALHVSMANKDRKCKSNSNCKDIPTYVHTISSTTPFDH